jgi:hypothetical protein
MHNKFWNRDGAWQKVINYLNDLGYECISISAERTNLTNVTSHNGQLIQDTVNDISGAEFHIGLNAGPSWIAYSLGIPFVMITGVSEEWNDPYNPYRVSLDGICTPCFNNTDWPIDRGWEWCPAKKDYACTREITEEMVIERIDQLMEDKSCRLRLKKVRGADTPLELPEESRQKTPLRKRPRLKRGSSTLSITDGNRERSAATE